MKMDVDFSPGCSISHCCRSGTLKGHIGPEGHIEGKYTVSNLQNKFDLSFEINNWGKKKHTYRYKATIPFNTKEMSGVYFINGNYGGEFKLFHY